MSRPGGPDRLGVRFGAAIAVAVAAVAAAGAASAGAAWSGPVTLSAAGLPAIKSDVGIASTGRTHFIWLRSDGINWRAQVVTRSAAGVVGTVRTMPGIAFDGGPFDSSYDPQVAVDSDGDAVFVWHSYNDQTGRVRVMARWRSGGALGPVQMLSPAGEDAGQAQVAVDLDDDAVVVWRQTDGAIKSRTLSAAGTLGPVQELSNIGVAVGCPQVAVDPDGDAVFAWVAEENGTMFRPWTIQGRARSAGGTLGPIETISGALSVDNCPDVGVDTGGDALFTWSRLDQNIDNRVQVRPRSATGVLGAIQTLSPSGADGNFPRIAVDPDGDAAVAWTSVASGFIEGIRGRARSAAGALGPVLNVAGSEALDPRVAIDAGGDAVFAWRRSVSSNPYRVQARTLAAGGALGPIDTLSAGGADASAPQLAVNPDGAAAVSWDRSDGTNTRVQAAFGP
jgi:hypothetical protein